MLLPPSRKPQRCGGTIRSVLGDGRTPRGGALRCSRASAEPGRWTYWMKLFTTFLFLLAWSLLTASEKEEPPLGYTLVLDEKTIRLAPGKEIQIKGLFENPKATLIPDKERLFTYGGITFKYPANFSFEADFKTEGVKIWSLDGNDFVIMVQHYETLKMTPKSFSEELRESYGTGTKTESRSYSFNGQKYSGVRVHLTLAGTKLIQDVLALPTQRGSRLLVLQDSPPEEKVSEDESKLVLRLLDETLKY